MGKNCLTINPSKLLAIIIATLLAEVVLPTNTSNKLNFSTIEISDCINYLGISIDSKLLFRDHIFNTRITGAVILTVFDF